VLQVEEDRVASAEPGEPSGRLTAAVADGQVVGAEDHQRLEVPWLQAHGALTVDRILEGAAGEHQAYRRQAG
jgi:hypothetical protein